MLMNKANKYNKKQKHYRINKKTKNNNQSHKNKKTIRLKDSNHNLIMSKNTKYKQNKKQN